MKHLALTLSLVILAGAHPPALAADAQRQAEVARLGADVMPFSLQATTHIFTPTADGGVQRIVAKNAADAAQVAMVRAHLHEIQAQFLKGDFSGPMHIHGAEMPGLAALKTAPPGQLQIAYQDVTAGAELSYHTAQPELVTALHQWFDAQLADHGHDAMAGHTEHMEHMNHDHGAMSMKP